MFFSNGFTTAQRLQTGRNHGYGYGQGRSTSFRGGGQRYKYKHWGFLLAFIHQSSFCTFYCKQLLPGAKVKVCFVIFVFTTCNRIWPGLLHFWFRPWIETGLSQPYPNFNLKVWSFTMVLIRPIFTKVQIPAQIACTLQRGDNISLVLYHGLGECMILTDSDISNPWNITRPWHNFSLRQVLGQKIVPLLNCTDHFLWTFSNCGTMAYMDLPTWNHALKKF